MKQLEMKFKGTKFLAHTSNVRGEIFDFIISNIRNHSFMGIGFYGDDDMLGRTIYSQASHTEETTLDDLVYEGAGEYITMLDWLDEHPDLTETYMGQEEQLYRWLTYLMEEDYIPKFYC